MAGAATLHLLLRYRRPATAVTWLFVLWWIPLLGALLYVAFGVYTEPNMIRRRRARTAHLRGPDRRLAIRATPYPPASGTGKLSVLSERIAAFPVVAGNALTLLGGDDAAYEEMFGLIAGAEAEVCVQTYILEEGAVALRLRDLLMAKAAEGVAVRLLFDPVGSYGLPAKWLRRAEEGGVSWVSYLPPRPLRGRFQINFRNHRKLLIIDGAAAVMGGQNWQDAHSSRARVGRGIRDFNVRVNGPVVASLRRVFVEDWCLAHESTRDPGALTPHLSLAAAEGPVPVRAVASGPDEDRPRFFQLALGAVQEARSDILVVSPFFVPGEPMLAALTHAALCGVKVRLLLPRRSDFLPADLAARHSFARLLASGVEIRLAEGDFLHAKALAVDDSWAIFGSSNFDHRSFHCNYELDLEVPDPAFARGVRDHFEPDLARAERVDPGRFARRSPWARAVSNAAALFEPLL